MATSAAYKAIEATILATAMNAGIPKNLALLIVAQAKHETGNFTSKVFRFNNNAFGYKFVPGAKLQLQAGRVSTEGDKYAHYLNLENSVKEVAAWIMRRVKEKKFPRDLATITTPEHYATLLKAAGYYGDPLAVYATGLKRFFSQNIAVVAGSGVLITVMAGLFFLMYSKQFR